MVAPHSTIIDTIVIGAARATVVAKAEISQHPFLGPVGNLLQVHRHICIYGIYSIFEYFKEKDKTAKKIEAIEC